MGNLIESCIVIAPELRVNLFVTKNPYLRDIAVLSIVTLAFEQWLLLHNLAEYRAA
jgi:hypothetical protein